MALEGTLQDMSLSDLFQIFRLGPKSGVLVLNEGAERGVIYVAEGRPIDAALLEPGRTVRAAQEEAIIQMLLWENAAFVFRHDPAVCQRPARITRDAEWLVMEGMRRREDPARALPYHSITLDSRLQLSSLSSNAESGVSLDVNQWRVLSQVSGSTSLAAICEVTGIAPERVVRTAVELLAIGLVEVAAPELPGPKLAPQPRPETLPALPAPALAPALAPAVAASLSGADARPQMGRGLIDAIMRRVRSL